MLRQQRQGEEQDEKAEALVSEVVSRLRKKLNLQNEYIRTLRRRLRMLREEQQSTSHTAQRLELLLHLQSQLPLVLSKQAAARLHGETCRARPSKHRSKKQRSAEASLPQLSSAQRQAWAKRRTEASRDKEPAPSQQDESRRALVSEEVHAGKAGAVQLDNSLTFHMCGGGMTSVVEYKNKR